MKEMLYVFSFTFFAAVHFYLASVAASISHFLTAATLKIFMLFFQGKKKFCFSFISRSRSLSLFSRWASLACRLLSLFLCLSLALYSKFVDMTINLSLLLWTTRIQKQFTLSFFIFIDSLVVSTLQDAGGYAISRQNNFEFDLGCHTCWLSYFTFVHLWCGRSGGWAFGHVITKISRMVR